MQYNIIAKQDKTRQSQDKARQYPNATRLDNTRQDTARQDKSR